MGKYKALRNVFCVLYLQRAAGRAEYQHEPIVQGLRRPWWGVTVHLRGMGSQWRVSVEGQLGLIFTVADLWRNACEGLAEAGKPCRKL